MTTAQEVEEPISSICRCILIKIVVAVSEPRSEVKIQGLKLNINRSELIDYQYFTWLRHFLVNLGVPQTFLDGCDSDMVENLSRNLCDSIQRSEAHTDYFSIFVVVLDVRCCYNIVNNMCFYRNPSSEFVQKMACEGGKYFLPAGASALVRFKVKEEEKDDCVICLDVFNCDDDAARLPCSHVCHYNCILKWFVKSSTCPMCRFQCSNVPCDH